MMPPAKSKLLILVSLFTLLAWVSLAIRNFSWLLETIYPDWHTASQSMFFDLAVFGSGLSLILAAVAIHLASVTLFRPYSFAIIASTVLCGVAVWLFGLPSLQVLLDLRISFSLSFSAVQDAAFCALLPMWIILSFRLRLGSTLKCNIG